MLKRLKIAFALYPGLLLALLFVQEKIDRHNMDVCYTNINTITVGSDINTALKKMKKGLINEKVFMTQYFNEKDTLQPYCYIEVTYPYLDKNDPVSHFPKIIFDARTGKVTQVITGMID